MKHLKTKCRYELIPDVAGSIGILHGALPPEIHRELLHVLLGLCM